MNAIAAAGDLWRGSGLRLALLFGIATLAGCTPERPPTQVRTFVAFGTVVEVQLDAVGPEAAAAAFAAIEARLRTLERDWRAFGPGELGRVNDRLAAGEPALLSPPLQRLAAQALELQRRSGGRYDPRVGALIELWGFQDLEQGLPADAPDPAAVAVARRAALSIDLTLDGRELRASGPVRLDLAGLAKGAALQAGAALLRDRGVEHALITIGGDIVAVGTRRGQPWRIGVRDPRGAGVLGRVALADGEAALSSGNYERYFQTPAGRAHHILDPATGRPSQGTAGVTVIARDAAWGNAAAVALMVGGRESFAALARALAVDCALLVTEDGERLLTPGMRQRLQAPQPDGT